MRMSSRKEVKIQTSSGSECTVNLHGATVTSWKNKGEEILFCSEKSVFDGKKAIRGGIPLVFPNFGPWELGPQHGFARIKQWDVASSDSESGESSSNKMFFLEDDEETRNMWKARFRLEYTVELADDCLKTSLQVYNKGDEAFSFTTLMHTYFRLEDISKARIKGLKGLKYDDKVNGVERTEERELVNIDENIDRIYKNCPGSVQLFPDKDKVASSRKIVTSNMTDIVVWNPWKDKAKAMADFGNDEYRNMLCVEAGSVSVPIYLGVGKNVTFSQNILVDKDSKI